MKGEMVFIVGIKLLGSGEVIHGDFRNAHSPTAQGTWCGRWRGQEQQQDSQRLEEMLAPQGRSPFQKISPSAFWSGNLLAEEKQQTRQQRAAPLLRGAFPAPVLLSCWAQRGDEVGVMSPAGSLSVRRGRMEVGDNSSEREAGVEGNSSLFQPEAFSSSEDERAFQTELTLTRRCCCGKDPMAQGWMQLEIHTLCFPLLSAPSRFSPLCPL